MVPITTNEALGLDLPDVPIDVSELQIDTETFNEWLDVDKDLSVFHVMNDDKIAASVSHNTEQGNDVGVHDEDECAEERVPVTRSEVFNAISRYTKKSCRRARHRPRLFFHVEQLRAHYDGFHIKKTDAH